MEYDQPVAGAVLRDLPNQHPPIAGFSLRNTMGEMMGRCEVKTLAIGGCQISCSSTRCVTGNIKGVTEKKQYFSSI